MIHQKMKCIVFLLFTLILSCSKPIQKDWVTTREGYVFWHIIDESVTTEYSWEGTVVENVIHRKGILHTYRQGSLVASQQLDAYWGAIAQEDVILISDNQKYIGNTEEDKLSGFGVFLKPPNEVYIGTFANSKPDGLLALYKDNKLYYKGYWENGAFYGQGTLYKEDGSIKRGIWENNRLVQTDTIVHLHSGKYIGYVANGFPEGSGTLEYTHGAIYKGGWKKGKWDGEGAYVSQYDSIVGDWKEGKLDGYGIVKSPQFFYEGDWIESKPDGIGNVVYADSTYYVGGWIAGKKDGYGDIVFSNDDAYMGEWKDNQFEGIGRYNFHTGETYNGEWKAGLQHGEGRYISEKFQYEGSWEEGWINGLGKMTFPNGDVYEGNFVENEKYGIGRYVFKNGNWYEGEFVDNQINGLGIFQFADGSRYEGEFANGKIAGDGTLFYVEGKDTLAITANWDGSNKFPKKASILFGNGDLYEGELINGFPTTNGIWTTAQEREEGIGEKLWSMTNRANDFYKRHKDTWNKVVIYTSVALTVVEVVGTTIVPVFPPTAVAVGVAAATNKVINIADAAIAAASAGIDATNAINNGEDPTEALATLGTEVAVNVALAKAPKVLKKVPNTLKKIPGRKLAVGLSTSVIKGTRKSVINLSKTKVFGKCTQIVKNNLGKLEMQLHNSKIGTFANRMRVGSKQFITHKQFQRSYDKVKNQLKLGKDADGQVLAHNMKKMMNKASRNILALEKKLSRKLGKKVAEAHHIVAGTKQTAVKSRKILERCGIDINDPRNGIFLPMHPNSIFKGSLHGKHIDQYDDYILKRLEEMVSKNGYSEEACARVLDDIKKELIKGNLQLLKNHRFNSILSAIF